MSDKSFNDKANAASLLETAIDLIRQVLIKHETAVTAEFRAIIEAKNHELKLVYAEREAAHTKEHQALQLCMAAEDRERRLKIRLGAAMGATSNEPPQLPPLTDSMYHAVRGLELEFSSGGPESVSGSINDDVLDEIWDAINTAMRVTSRDSGQNPVVTPTKPLAAAPLDLNKKAG